MAVVQRVLYVLLPAMALYGGVRTFIGNDFNAALCSPFFGLGKLSTKRGALVWGISLTMLGVILLELSMSYRSGQSPLLPL